MKKKLLIVLLSLVCALCLAFGLSACGGGSSDSGETTEYTVTFDANGGKFSDGKTTCTVTIDAGFTLEEPTEPTRSDFAFSGWAKNSDGSSYWNFTSDTVTSDITLYAVWAENDSLAYSLSDDGTYYTVTGLGDLSGDIEVPETYGDIPVTAIAEGAFTKYSNITSIVIGDNVTTIEAKSFDSCTKLTSVTIGEGVTVIPQNAFYSLTALTTLTLPSSLVQIERGGFYGCTNFVDIYYNGTVSGWCEIDTHYDSEDNSAYYSNPLIWADNLYINGELLTEAVISDAAYISDMAFYDYDNLTSVTIGSSVKTIGDRAFYSCNNISSLTFEQGSAQSIGKNAFYFCDSFETLALPDSTETIGEYAFCYCTDLKTLTTGNGLQKMDEGAFCNCSSLSSVTLGSLLMSIGAYSFYQCSLLTSISLPASLLFIGGEAFTSTLTSATFAKTTGWSAGTSSSDVIDSTDLEDPENAAKLLTTSILHGGYWERDWERLTLTYTLNSDKASYTVSNDGTVTLSSITIPSTYNGLPVTKIAANAFYNCTSLTSITIPNSVTSIGNKAFEDCTSLESVTIGDGVTSIGDNAFNYCTALTNITIPNSVTSIGDKAFYRCSSLTSVTIGSSVTSIGSSAFDNCYKLVEIYNLSSLEITAGSTGNGYVGWYAKNVYIATSGSSNLIKQNGYIFYNDNGMYYLMGYTGSETALTLPNLTINGATVSYTIYQYAFYENTKITSMIISNSITSIGEYAFCNCTSLNSITIGSNVTSIGKAAFYDCTALSKIYFNAIAMENLTNEGNKDSYTSNAFRNAGKNANKLTVTIDANVTKIPLGLFCSSAYITSIVFKANSKCESIGDYAFEGCSSLTSINLPDSITSIGNYAFYKCTSLKSISIPEKATSIGWLAFYNCTALTEIFYNAISIDEVESGTFNNAGKDGAGITVTIGANATKIPSDIFRGNGGDSANIVNVVFEDGSVCESIGEDAFYECTALTSVNLPDGLTSIGDSAFYRCSSLTSITIPNSVTSIGKTAFSNCTSLESVTIGNSVTSIGGGAFSSCTSLTSITIPASVTYIGASAFGNCTELTSVTFENTNGWHNRRHTVSSSVLSSTSGAAYWLVIVDYQYEWSRSDN